MKKILFFALAIFGSLSSFAQQEEKSPFDYQVTKHELSLDLLPVITGLYPFDLLYRKHYISKKGHNVGLRLGLQLGTSYSTNNTTENQSQDTNTSSHNFLISVGKERQMRVSKNILSYFGIDFGAGYSNSKAHPIVDDPNAGVTKSIHNSINFSSTGFLGFKYHLSPNFSIGAETGVSVFYNHRSTTRTFESNNYTETYESSQDNVGLQMNHIRSIRFAFHF